MDEEFIPNFWVSSEKPKNLSDKWFWVEDVEDIVTLVDAYYILFPESNVLHESECYISLPIYEFNFYDWWLPYIAEKGNFILIWRPSICDPIEEDNDDYYLDFDIEEDWDENE